MSMTQQTTEGAAVMGKLATVATYGGAGGAIASGLSSETVFGLTTSEWTVVGVIGGMIIGVLGLLVNAYFKRQHLLIAMRTAKADPDE